MPDLVSDISLEAEMWTTRLWPFALALLLLAVNWSRSRHRIAAFIFCSLLGFGVQWIIGSLLVRLPVSVPTNVDDHKALLRVFIVTGWRNLFVSLICSIPLVLWLTHFFRAPKSLGADP